MGNVHVVGPNEALVISGGCCGSSSKRFITGGWAWTCCLVSDIQKLTLEVFTLNPKCEKIESKQGVPINVNAIAQCKIDKARVSTAAEMFLGKDLDYIKLVVLQTIEGHLRAITGTLTMEEIYMERQTFATLVTEMASKDLENFGIALLSFTIKEISDKVDYLTSMGRKEIAKTKHKAAIDVANVEKDFKIKESDAELAIKETEYKTNREIEEQNKQLKTESAKQNFIVNTKRKEAEMAYELETAKIQQKIAKEKKNVLLEEITMKHSILQNDLKLKENELHCDIILPAEAEAYRIKKVSELESYRKLALAEANSKKMKKIADATSEVIRLNGRAQVELMKNRAAAFSNYNEAAVLKLTLAALPKIAAEICAPLKNINEIVLVNGPSNQPASTNFASEASRMASELPVTMKALTGVNLNRAFDNLINILPNNVPATNSQSQNFKNELIPETYPQGYNQQVISNISTKTNIDSNYKVIDSPSRSSKTFESRTSSVSNLSKQSKNSKQSLLNTKPKSVSNLSIQTVK